MLPSARTPGTGMGFVWILIIVMLLLILVINVGCGPNFYHANNPRMNPCIENTQWSDSTACNEWKNDYPKEYARIYK